MSTEFPPDIIQTATVAIFSPDRRYTVVIYNETCDMVNSPGWKKQKKDPDILAVAVREVQEEIWLILNGELGDFLNIHGEIISKPEPVSEHDFIFPHDWSQARDFFYFFQLRKYIDQSLLRAEKQGFYYTKSQAKQSRVIIEWQTYKVFDDATRTNIFNIMWD